MKKSYLYVLILLCLVPLRSGPALTSEEYNAYLSFVAHNNSMGSAQEYWRWESPDGQTMRFTGDFCIIRESGLGMPRPEYTKRTMANGSIRVCGVDYEPRIVEIDLRYDACDRCGYYNAASDFANITRPDRVISCCLERGKLVKRLPDGSEWYLKAYIDSAPDVGMNLSGLDVWDNNAMQDTVRFIADEPRFFKYTSSSVTITTSEDVTFSEVIQIGDDCSVDTMGGGITEPLVPSNDGNRLIYTVVDGYFGKLAFLYSDFAGPSPKGGLAEYNPNTNAWGYQPDISEQFENMYAMPNDVYYVFGDWSFYYSVYPGVKTLHSFQNSKELEAHTNYRGSQFIYFATRTFAAQDLSVYRLDTSLGTPNGDGKRLGESSLIPDDTTFVTSESFEMLALPNDDLLLVFNSNTPSGTFKGGSLQKAYKWVHSAQKWEPANYYPSLIPENANQKGWDDRGNYYYMEKKASTWEIKRWDGFNNVTLVTINDASTVQQLFDSSGTRPSVEVAGYNTLYFGGLTDSQYDPLRIYKYENGATFDTGLSDISPNRDLWIFSTSSYPTVLGTAFAQTAGTANARTSCLSFTNNGHSHSGAIYTITSGNSGETVYSIFNPSNGQGLFFVDFFLLDNETITIDTENLTVTSNIRGDMSSYVAPNSDFSSLAISPGENSFRITVDGVVSLEASYEESVLVPYCYR